MFVQSNNNHVNVVQNCFKVNENDIEQTQWHSCGVIVNFKFSNIAQVSTISENTCEFWEK